jgi:hypothetical protein
MTTPIIIRQFVAIVLVIAVAVSSAVALNLVLATLTLYALFGPTRMVHALALSVLLKYLNPTLASYNSLTGFMFWVMLLVIGVRHLPTMRANHLKILLPIFMFSILAVVLSYLSSKAVAVSVMKAATFAWVIPSVIVGFMSIAAHEFKALKTWCIAYSSVVVILSTLTLVKPAIAYATVPGSLQGILNQPQALGIFVAPLAAWSIAGLISMRGKSRPHEIGMAIIVTAVMLLSLARTAALAACIGIVVAASIPLLARARNTAQSSVARIATVLILGALTIGAVGISTGTLFESVNDFILKRNNQDLEKAFYDSRGVGIVSQWENFIARPILGNGFGVFANGEFPAGIVKWKGIPISAPVEKGFLPSAILEETGAIGALLFLVMIAIAAHETHKNSDLRWIAAFWAAIMVNLGEAVILAPGGLGLYVWLILGMCISLGRLEEKSATTNLPARTERNDFPSFPNLMH